VADEMYQNTEGNFIRRVQLKGRLIDILVAGQEEQSQRRQISHQFEISIMNAT
jgi:hypothetical protein